MRPRSREHGALRAGKISGSRFATIMDGGPRAWDTLMRQLRHEREHGFEFSENNGPAPAWGVRHEPQALALYQLQEGVMGEEIAWIPHPTLELVGVSPDLVLLEGGVEVKCPYNAVYHQRTLMEGMPAHHTPQVQGTIWCADVEWWDFVSFDPRIPEGDPERLYVERIYRDEDYIDRLHETVLEFIELYTSGEAASHRGGYDPDLLERMTF